MPKTFSCFLHPHSMPASYCRTRYLHFSLYLKLFLYSTDFSCFLPTFLRKMRLRSPPTAFRCVIFLFCRDVLCVILMLFYYKKREKLSPLVFLCRIRSLHNLHPYLRRYISLPNNLLYLRTTVHRRKSGMPQQENIDEYLHHWHIVNIY